MSCVSLLSLLSPARQLQLLQHPTHTISFWCKKNLLQFSTSGTNLHFFNTAGCVCSSSSISWNYGRWSVLKSQLFISRILSIHFFLLGLFCRLLSNWSHEEHNCCLPRSNCSQYPGPPPCLLKIMLLASAMENFWVIFFNMDTFSELEILKEIGLYLHFHTILVLGKEHVI